MQYVLLIYQGNNRLPGTDAWTAMSHEEQKARYAELSKGYEAVNETPGVTAGLPLGYTRDARTVRVDNGKTLIDEGPYLGANGAVGGYAVLEAEDMDAAIELASKIPAARFGGAVEVRPAEKYW
jgi:hypothetical protein